MKFCHHIEFPFVDRKQLRQRPRIYIHTDQFEHSLYTAVVYFYQELIETQPARQRERFYPQPQKCKLASAGRQTGQRTANSPISPGHAATIKSQCGRKRVQLLIYIHWPLAIWYRKKAGNPTTWVGRGKENGVRRPMQPARCMRSLTYCVGIKRAAGANMQLLALPGAQLIRQLGAAERCCWALKQSPQNVNPPSNLYTHTRDAASIHRICIIFSYFFGTGKALRECF